MSLSSYSQVPESNKNNGLSQGIRSFHITNIILLHMFNISLDETSQKPVENKPGCGYMYTQNSLDKNSFSAVVILIVHLLKHVPL